MCRKRIKWKKKTKEKETEVRYKKSEKRK